MHARIDTTPAATGKSAVTATAYREAMSHVAAAVHLVTTDGPAGKSGFTATAVASVSDSPPTLLVCLRATAGTAKPLEANRAFCVNTLAAEDRPLADIFAGRAGLHLAERFAEGDWRTLATGAPLLCGALVAFDCRLVDIKPVATHFVLFGAVEAVHFGPQRPALLYAGRHYRSV